MELATPPQSPQPKNARISDVVRQARKRPASAKKSFQSPLEQRRRGSHTDIDVEDRQAAVAEYRAALGPGGRLKPGGVALLLASFEKQNLSMPSVRRWHNIQRKAELEGAGPTEARRSLASKRKGRAATNTKLTVPIAEKILEINARSWGRLSNKRLLGELKKALPEEGNVSEDTVRRWCKALGAKRRRQYIKPLLRLRHKLDRLAWVLEQEITGDKLGDNKNTVHVDEKWFYIMNDGAVCRCFPDDDGNYTIPEPRKLYHKNRMPKLMFLSAVARPRPEYGFDGKIGIWYFAVERKAKRSHKATGTIKGVTDILETVTVDAKEYRTKLCCKGGVMDAIREKMWWFKEGSGQPEAGKTIWLQHDGARPHTAQVNLPVYKAKGKQGGFKILVCTQPAQSPDLNVNDLGFFNSLQSDTYCVTMKNIKELKVAVQKCWEEYSSERLERCWRCLTISMHGIMESGGDNVYLTHRGDRKRHLAHLEEVREIDPDVRKKAERALDKLRRDWNRLEAGDVDRVESDSSDSETGAV
jgi:hypothetical protein